jgi:predicted nucleic acid-binding protein
VIVVDASIAVKWFVEEEGHLAALGLLERNLFVIAPDLIFSETANVLWKKLRRGEVTSEQAERACDALPDFFQDVISAALLAKDALRLATQLDHPVYDCIYLVCAQQLGGKLVTADGKFVSHLKEGGFGHLVVGLDQTPALVKGGDLSISEAELNRVLALSDQFTRTLSFVEGRVARPIGGGTLRWVNTADLTPAFDSPSRRRLEEAVSALPRETLSDLVALAWLGRGFDGNNWASLHADAREMLGNDPLQHLRYIISLLNYVQAGLQKISNLREQTPDQTNPNPNQET